MHSAELASWLRKHGLLIQKSRVDYVLKIPPLWHQASSWSVANGTAREQGDTKTKCARSSNRLSVRGLLLSGFWAFQVRTWSSPASVPGCALLLGIRELNTKMARKFLRNDFSPKLRPSCWRRS